MDTDETITYLINFLSRDVKYVTNDRTVLKKSVEVLSQFATEHGLNPHSISNICEIITRAEFPAAILGQLIGAMVPRNRVYVQSALCAAHIACQVRYPSTVRRQLLLWLAAVYDVIDDRQKLHALYGVLFHYLRSEVLVGSVAHLLVKMTGKCDVKRNRVRKLMVLRSKYWVGDHVDKLLATFKRLCPAMLTDIDVGTITLCADEKQLGAMQRVNLPIANLSLSCGIANRTSSLIATTSAILGKLEGMLRRKKKPGEVKELISSGMEFYSDTVRLSMDKQACDRVCHGLNHSLRKLGAEESDNGIEVFELLHYLSHFIPQVVSVGQAFMTRYLCAWNGVSYRAHIFKLIEKLPICSYQHLQATILEPILKLCSVSSDIEFKRKAAVCLTNLLKRHVSTCSKHSKRCDAISLTAIQPKRLSIMSSSSTSSQSEDTQTIKQFVFFIDKLFLQCFLTEKLDCVLHWHFLSFHHLMSAMYTKYGIEIGVLPPSLLLSSSLLSTSAVALDRVCTILTNHKRSVAELNRLDDEQEVSGGCLEQYLREGADTLWRGHAFADDADSLIYKDVQVDDDMLADPDVMPLNNMFSVDRHPALSHVVKHYLHVTSGDKDVPILHNHVIRDEFCTFLTKYELNGLVEFIDQQS